MSEERVNKIMAAPAATPNRSSIMSAPQDKKKTQRFIIIIASLAISLALNIVLAIVAFSKNEKINSLQKDLNDSKTLITELKNKINAME